MFNAVPSANRFECSVNVSVSEANELACPCPVAKFFEAVASPCARDDPCNAPTPESAELIENPRAEPKGTPASMNTSGCVLPDAFETGVEPVELRVSVTPDKFVVPEAALVFAVNIGTP